MEYSKKASNCKLLLLDGYYTRNPSLKVKLDAIHRCFELGENIKSVSENIGYSRASIISGANDI